MDARKQIEKEIAGAVVEAVKSPTTNATASDAKEISDAVKAEIVPIVMNQTNQEPWYQSHVTMGAIVFILLKVLAQLGWAVPADLHGPILDLVIAVGPYLAFLWVMAGRWILRYPIGEGPILRRVFFWRRKTT